MLRVGGAKELLSLELGSPINVLRSCLVFLPIGAVLFAREDIVGGDVNHGQIKVCGYLAQFSDCNGIKGARAASGALSAVSTPVHAAAFILTSGSWVLIASAINAGSSRSSCGLPSETSVMSGYWVAHTERACAICPALPRTSNRISLPPRSPV